ncbi:MAG: T9SS type A sorting domain-containing protein, partial [Candidatus Cloacimonadaceae bacterium]|nr:T9SS type A sorting domain-containing protein [Candidatus Cloacimonadaceae bacterium]
SASAALLDLDSDGNIYWAWGGELFGIQIITKLLPNGQLPIDDDVQAPPVNTISAYPNPMKDEVTIKIKQDVQSPSTDNSIDIFNIKGQLIRTLKLTKGETVWDGKDRSGKPCPKGIYLLRYQYGSSQITKICKTR